MRATAGSCSTPRPRRRTRCAATCWRPALGIEPEQIHVVTPDVGGGFGAKASVYAEDILTAWCARRVGQPVRWSETRSESMLGLGHGRGQIQDVEIGGTRDGHILAYRIDVLQDSGAYPAIGAMLPFMTRTMATGVYAIAEPSATASVVTNTVPTVAYRGAGRPEATAALERVMDCYANEIGMDPAESAAQTSSPPTPSPSRRRRAPIRLRQLRARLRPRPRDGRLRRAPGRAGSRRDAGRATRASSASGYRPTSRSRTVPGGEYGAVEIRPDGGPSSARGPRRTGRATTRPGRCSSPSARHRWTTSR